MSSNLEVEPGAASESVLVATDSFPNLEHMGSSLEEIKQNSTLKPAKSADNLNNSDNDEEAAARLAQLGIDDEEEAFQNSDWPTKNKHVFVLSLAGKPIYTRYGNDDKLAWLFGVMQTLVSFVQSNDDSIKSITAGDTSFVFLVKKPLILVAVSRHDESRSQVVLQLNYVFNQIVSILTLTRLNKIYEQRQNYDLRRLLTGVERLLDHILDFTETQPAFFLGAVQSLRLSSSVRNNISSAITSACNKIKNLVFAILLAGDKLITLVRMKKYSLHPTDLHLIFNLVQSSGNFKVSETWLPICLPRFDGSGFLYGHVSYLAEDCQACLLLLTVERDMFHTLNEAKQRIVEKMRRGNVMEAINEAITAPEQTCAQAGFPEVRHYLYKSKSIAQFHQPGLSPPYSKDKLSLMSLYRKGHQKLDRSNPLKLYVERSLTECFFLWDTPGFDLYVVFEPLIEIEQMVATITRLLNWMKEREDKLFHLNVPTF